MDGWMDDFIYPDPSPKRYAGYHNYICPCTSSYIVLLHPDEFSASSRPVVAYVLVCCSAALLARGFETFVMFLQNPGQH